MATNITTSYAGQAAEGYVAAATLAGPTLANPNITVHEYVEGKMVVRNLDAGGTLIADATCDFTSSGDVNYSEGILDLKSLQINLQDCKENWVKTWEQANRRALILDQAPPVEMADWMLQRLGKKSSGSIENLVWNGDSVTAGQFDGLIKAISAAKAAAPDVVFGAVITKDNVIDALQAMMTAVDPAVYSSLNEEDGFAIYVPMLVDQMYQLALGVNAGGSYGGTVTVDRKPMNFNGIPLIPTPGLTSTTMVGAKKGDLHFGCNLLADNNEARIIDMTPTDGSQNFRYVLRFQADTIVTNPTNITWGTFTA